MQLAEGSVTITFNGEIYNYRELRALLSDKGYSFKSSSDTEVLLAGYLHYGTNILQKLNGIFAFGIFDARIGDLFIARDHFGVKPIYYAKTKSSFIFASEIKTLLKMAPIGRDIDLSAIRRYLTFLACPGEQTALKHVKKMAPGTAMIVRRGEVVRDWSYWSPPKYEPRHKWNVADCAAELNDLFGLCVKRQMISDAPLGAFLSGGIDSSAIVAAARKLNTDFQCFTIELEGGSEEGTEDDLPYAKMVATHLNVALNIVPVDSQSLCNEVVNAVNILEEPLADPASVNLLFICQHARSLGMKVLLSGVGGDDIFAGYRRHSLLKFNPLWSAIPTALRQAAASSVRSIDSTYSTQRRLAKLLNVISADGDLRIATSFSWGVSEDLENLVSREVRTSLDKDDVFFPMLEVLANSPNTPPLEKCLMLEKRFFLSDHNLIYTDKMSMAAGVEVRVPFLDLDLINFASQIPASWKHSMFQGKWIFKQSQKSMLPDEIINRPKTGFGVPLRRWMKHEMNDMKYDLLSASTVKQRNIFDPSAIQKMLKLDEDGRIDASYTLFSVMCIELWCRRFVG